LFIFALGIVIGGLFRFYNRIGLLIELVRINEGKYVYMVEKFRTVLDLA
jgi:hypothetical protein